MARREIAPQAFLAALPMFKSLDEAALARLAAATTRRALARGRQLYGLCAAARAVWASLGRRMGATQAIRG